MRLICPNCGAQYEVADDVIPQAGRDVQCSNCGHTWLERPGVSVKEERDTPTEPQAQPEPAPAPAPAPAPEIDATPEVDQSPEAEPAADTDPVLETDSVPETDPVLETEADPTPEPNQEDEPKPRTLAPDVADILRQEADFEQAARDAEHSLLETQPDLDLSHDLDESPRNQDATDRASGVHSPLGITAAVSATMAQDADAPRRELLPDIEEINSTLRPDAAPTETDYVEDAPRRRSGFRRGFMLMVLLAVIALALYVFAPQISAAVPQAESVLTSYVDWVDTKRIWLDQKVHGFLDNVDGGADVAAPEADTSPAADVTTDAPEVPVEPDTPSDSE